MQKFGLLPLAKATNRYNSWLCYCPSYTQPRNSGATTSEFKPAAKPVEERTQVLATCTETGTEGASTYTICRGSIHGELAAAAEAPVDAETTSALGLIGVTEISENLQEQH